MRGLGAACREHQVALPPVFAALAASGVPIVHYKVCSTFDSAPGVKQQAKAGKTLIVCDPRGADVALSTTACDATQSTGYSRPNSGNGSTMGSG